MDEWCVAVDFRAQLAEGLHWDAQRGQLWFVDIHGRRVACWLPRTSAWTEWATPQRVGWVIPIQGSADLLAGFQSGVARLSLSDGLQYEWVCHLLGAAPQLRLNDAKADSSGAVSAGSLNGDDETRSDACLFRIDAAAGTSVVVDAGYQVANGPAIHPDGRLMLHNDSGRRTIYAFDLDVGQGRAVNRRVWKVLAEHEGYPDGMGFDAEGCLWLANWGAGCISRYSRRGELLRRVALPTRHISNLCFGGAGLDRLFVTSARAGLAAQRQRAPHGVRARSGC